MVVKLNGGTKATLAVLTGLVIAGVVGVTGWVAGEQSEHQKLPGHPTVVERVDGLQADVAEIKSDVKELLRRP